MAAIAPCAHYGCGSGHFDHLRNCHGSGTIQKDTAMSSRLRRLFLELKPLQQKHWEAQQLVQQCPAQQVCPFVKAILDQPVALDAYSQYSNAGKSLYAYILRLWRPTSAMLLPLQKCVATITGSIAWLFPDDGDVDGAAAFLRNLLWNKEAMMGTCRTLNEANPNLRDF